jgi:hypothetical protein
VVARNFLSILFQLLDSDISGLPTVARMSAPETKAPTDPIPPDGIPIDPETGAPPEGTPLLPFTCPWAQDGLRKAMDGMNAASSGVEGYGVGSRHLRYRTVAEHGVVVDYWMKMVEYYCGIEALPTALTGRDTAFRVIPRDV